MKILLLITLYTMGSGNTMYSQDIVDTKEAAAILCYEKAERAKDKKTTTEYKLYEIKLPDNEIKVIQIPSITFNSK